MESSLIHVDIVQSKGRYLVEREHIVEGFKSLVN